MFEIYTDGSNTFNGKSHSYGGYGFIIKIIGSDDDYIEDGGSMFVNELDPVTNNKAELLAIISSLEFIANKGFSNTEFVLYSDSQWCVKSINREWKLKKNLNLWSRFNKAKQNVKRSGNALTVKWVKGHAGNVYNEKVDKLAKHFKDLAKPQ